MIASRRAPTSSAINSRAASVASSMDMSAESRPAKAAAAEEEEEEGGESLRGKTLLESRSAAISGSWREFSGGVQLEATAP